MNGRQLVRSDSDKRIAGVAGGIAAYFGLDPTLVRIVFVIGAFMGWGVIAYLVLWIVMPRGEPGWAGAPASRSSAVRIAEERFARGEITAEELAQIRADLTGGGR